MAGNILKAVIDVSAPGAKEAFEVVAMGVRVTERGLSGLQKSVVAFGGGVKSFTSGLTSLNTPLVKLPPVIDIATRSLSKLPNAANQSTQALTNLGRVVQDAPFGFLGIANNLNPLLESFQRLKATTGTTGGALKALGSSLLGAGGLGFALSIVSTALILFGDKIFGASKKTDEAKEAADRYKESVKGIFQETAKEATSVATFVAVLKSETETRERRLAAIKELQRIQPEIFAGLKLEGDTVVGLDAAYLNYIKSLSTVIAVKLKQLQLETLITKQLQNQGATLTQSQKDALQGLTSSQKVLVSETGKALGVQKEVTKEQLLQTIYGKENAALEKDIAAIIKDISELSKGVKIPGANAADKKAAKDLAFEFDALKQIFIDLIAINKVFADQLQKDIKIRLNIQTEIGEGAGSAFDSFTKEIPAISSRLQKDVDALTKTNPILITAQAGVKLRSDAVEKLKKDLDSINNLISAGIGDSIAGFAEGLGEALSGGGITKAFQAFASLVGSGIQAIGKQLIVLGTTALLAKQALTKLFSNPGIMIAAGIALVAVGAALKNLLSGGIKGFAQGGKVQKGVPILVGEQGKEIFVPDSSGKIIPNHQITNTSSHADSRTDSHLEKKEFVKVIIKPVVESSLLNTFSSIIKNIFHRVYNTENKSESNQDNRFYESLVTKVDSLTKGDVFKNSVNNNEETVKNSVKSELSILETFSSLVKNIFKSVQNHTENYNTENNDNRRFSSPFTKIEGDVIYNTRLNTFFSKFSEFIKNISSVYNVKKESSYAVGGFTGAGGRSEPAGIVHKGEYVIPAFAVQKLGISFLNQLAFGHNIRGFQSGGFVGNPVSSGGMNIQVSGYLTGRGNDLIAVISAATRSQGRLT